MKKEERKYELCIIAIQNLLKKGNYLELFEQYSSEDMTFEEYKAELEKNNEKYVIELHKLESDGDRELIMEIMKDVGNNVNDLSVLDVSEMFSLTNLF
jgi:hypothetical protein